MVINLSKVERNCLVNLSKDENNIEKVEVTLGWDSAKGKAKGFFAELFGSGDE